MSKPISLLESQAWGRRSVEPSIRLSSVRSPSAQRRKGKSGLIQMWSKTSIEWCTCGKLVVSVKDDRNSPILLLSNLWWESYSLLLSWQEEAKGRELQKSLVGRKTESQKVISVGALYCRPRGINFAEGYDVRQGMDMSRCSAFVQQLVEFEHQSSVTYKSLET